MRIPLRVSSISLHNGRDPSTPCILRTREVSTPLRMTGSEPSGASCQSFEETLPQEAQLLPCAESDFRGEDVVLFQSDLREQAAVNIG